MEKFCPFLNPPKNVLSLTKKYALNIITVLHRRYSFSVVMPNNFCNIYTNINGIASNTTNNSFVEIIPQEVLNGRMDFLVTIIELLG